MKTYKNIHGGYSVVVSVLMVGFLLIISTGVFNLVLTELNDNRGRENYLKASAGAEGALEMALLGIKQNGYGYFSEIEDSVNNKSIMLSKDVLDIDDFRANDVRISYSMDSKVSSYNGVMEPLGFDIIPLFYLDDSEDPENRVTDIMLDVDGDDSGLSWNIISTNGGVSGQGEFSGITFGLLKQVGVSGFIVENKRLRDFLGDISRENNYLILFNTDSSTQLSYTLTSAHADEYFTKPRTEIISSSRVGKYKQSFRTTVDNTEYLNLLKYSVFSN